MKMEFKTLNIIGYFEFHAEILKQGITLHSLLSMYIKNNLLNRRYVCTVCIFQNNAYIFKEDCIPLISNDTFLCSIIK